jgi:hypothetical protein
MLGSGVASHRQRTGGRHRPRAAMMAGAERRYPDRSAAVRAEGRPPTSDTLEGWKSIAGYLGRSPRTAQRWERNLGLPVRRFGTGRGETVRARTSELDEWLEGGFAERPAARADAVPAPPDSGREPQAFRYVAAVGALVGLGALALWWVLAG